MTHAAAAARESLQCRLSVLTGTGHAAGTTMLEQRITRLERHNRRLTAGLVALVSVGLLAGAVDRPAEIAAQAFRVYDEAGTLRAELAMRDGVPGLFIRDEAGNDRLIALHDAEGTGVYLNDPDGTTRVGMAQFAHGGGGVALHGPEARGATVLYHKGEGSLVFFAEDGEITHRVLAHPEDALPAEPRSEVREEPAEVPTTEPVVPAPQPEP